MGQANALKPRYQNAALYPATHTSARVIAALRGETLAQALDRLVREELHRLRPELERETAKAAQEVQEEQEHASSEPSTT